MKQKVGIIIVCILAVILIVVGGAYHFLFHNIDDETKKQIDDAIGAISDQVNEQIQTEKEQLTEEENEGSGEGSANQGNVELSEEVAAVITDGTESLTKTTASLLEIYYSGMESLSQEGNAIVDQLLSNAKKDYKELKKNGGGKQDMMTLASAYSNQASAMESGMDASVEALLTQLKDDLTGHGMAGKEADGIVKQLREEYKKQKSDRYNEIMEKYKKIME